MSFKSLFRSNEVGRICGESRDMPRNLKMLCEFAHHLSQSKRLGVFVNVNPSSAEDFGVLSTVKRIQEVKGLKGNNQQYIENVFYCVTALRLMRRVYLMHLNLVRENFDVFNAQRVNMLDSLWAALQPNVKRTGLISKDWTNLGFQGSDPSTDFRGTGMLGLHQLVYFSHHKQQSARHILEESMSTQRSCKFPFAITGISITHFIMELFAEDKLHKVVFDYYLSHSYRGDVKGGCTEDQVYIENCFNCLNDIYCMIFEEFYMLWMVRNPTDIMAFQILFQELQFSIRTKLLSLKQVIGIKS